MQDALKNYQKAVKLDPTLIEAWVNLGNVLEDLGRSSEAVEMYKKAITVEPVLEDEEDEKGSHHHTLSKCARFFFYKRPCAQKSRALLSRQQPRRAGNEAFGHCCHVCRL